MKKKDCSLMTRRFKASLVRLAMTVVPIVSFSGCNEYTAAEYEAANYSPGKVVVQVHAAQIRSLPTPS